MAPASKILITGSNGRLGRILKKALAGSFDIYGLYIKGKEDSKNFIEDISNLEALDNLLRLPEYPYGKAAGGSGMVIKAAEPQLIVKKPTQIPLLSLPRGRLYFAK